MSRVCLCFQGQPFGTIVLFPGEVSSSLSGPWLSGVLCDEDIPFIRHHHPVHVHMPVGVILLFCFLKQSHYIDLSGLEFTV